MKFITLIALLNLCIQNVLSETFTECENLEDGTFIQGTQGCKSYIYCEGDDSYEGFCPAQLLFNAKDGSCAPENEVDCVDGDPELTTEAILPTTTTTTIRTIETTEKFEPEDTTLPPEQSTNVQTTPNTVKSTSPNAGDGSAPMCPTTDNPNEVILLPSETSCSEYYICYHGLPVRMSCSGRLYFDYVTSKCEIPERVNCKVGTMTTKNPKKECVTNIYDYYPYPKNCNYFYKCMNGFLSLQQCPIGFGWSEDMKLCLKLDQGQCPLRTAEEQLSHSWLG